MVDIMRRNNQLRDRDKQDPKVLLKIAQQKIDYIIKIVEEGRFDTLDEKVVDFYKFISSRDFPLKSAKLFHEFVSTAHQGAYIKECQKNYIDAVSSAQIGNIDQKNASIALLRENSMRAKIAGSAANLQNVIDKLTLIADQTTKPSPGNVLAIPAVNSIRAYPNNKRRATRIIAPQLIVSVNSVLSIAQDWSMYGMRIRPIIGSFCIGDIVAIEINLERKAVSAGLLCERKGKCATVVSYNKDELTIKFSCQCIEVIRTAIYLKNDGELKRK